MIRLDAKNPSGRDVLLSPSSISPDIIADVKALPWDGKGLIAGNDSQVLPFIKQRRLDIAQGAKFTFLITDIRINRIFIVAEELVIQGPASLAEVSEIYYKLNFSLSGTKPAKAAGGADHRTEQSGANGGNGVTGSPGGDAGAYSAPALYVFFQTINIIRPNPSVSTLLSFNFPGMQGAIGGDGGDGGDAGWGAKGTHAEDNTVFGRAVSCKSGPGVGGSSGVPGSGGRGGNAGNGGDGSTVVICGPQSQSSHISFTAELKGGAAGLPGGPGNPGAQGEPGSGGDLSQFCRDGRPGGYKHSASPIDLGPGDPAHDGQDGNYHVEYRDNSDIFLTF